MGGGVGGGVGARVGVGVGVAVEATAAGRAVGRAVGEAVATATDDSSGFRPPAAPIAPITRSAATTAIAPAFLESLRPRGAGPDVVRPDTRSTGGVRRGAGVAAGASDDGLVGAAGEPQSAPSGSRAAPGAGSGIGGGVGPTAGGTGVATGGGTAGRGGGPAESGWGEGGVPGTGIGGAIRAVEACDSRGAPPGPTISFVS